MTPEQPIKTSEARRKLGWSMTYMASVLHQLKIPGARKVFLRQLVQFQRNNPLHKISDVYPAKKREPLKVGGAINLSHGRTRYRFRIGALTNGRPDQLKLVEP